MKLDKEIFTPEAKLHPVNYLQPNDFDYFVDFTRLPEKIPKNAKNLLYRPKLMAKLKESFDKIVKEIENEDWNRHLENEAWKAKKHKSLNFYERLIEKPESELKIIKDLLQFIHKWTKSEQKEK